MRLFTAITLKQKIRDSLYGGNYEDTGGCGCVSCKSYN